MTISDQLKNALMAKKHGVKQEGSRGKFTKEQAEKLASMR